MKRILVFGASGDKLGGINTFLIEMNRHMSEDCIFDYVIEGPNSVNHKEIIEKGGKEFHTVYYKQNPIKKIAQTFQILQTNKKDHDVAYFNLYSTS